MQLPSIISSRIARQATLFSGKLSLVAAMAFVSPRVAHAQAVLVGPFAPGSGTWTTVLNGGFEAGNINGWSSSSNVPGTNILASADRAISGGFSAKAVTTQTFGSGGFGMSRNVSVTPGVQYVLSGFFFTGNSTSGTTYLDSGGIPGGVEVGSNMANGISAWQFSYGTFTATSGSVNLRFIRDARLGSVLANQPVYVDEIALTPASQFVAPTVLTATPEPGSIALFGSLLAPLAILTRRRHLRSAKGFSTRQSRRHV